MKLFFYILPILFLCTSCTFLIRKVGYGYKKPQVETLSQIEKDWQKVSKKYPTYIFKIPDGNSVKDSIYTKNVNRALTFAGEILNGAMVFNKKKEKIDLFNGKVCLGKTDTFFENVDLKANHPIIPNRALSKYLSYVEQLDRSPLPEIQNQEVDFYVVVPWSNWLSVTKDDAKKWIKLISNNKEVKFYIIPVNVDIINDWQDAKILAKDMKFNIN
jgi:hypothetical protein